MNDVVPAAILIGALLAAVYVMRSVRAKTLGAVPPPGTVPGTLNLGQYAIQPGAQWLVLTPGSY